MGLLFLSIFSASVLLPASTQHSKLVIYASVVAGLAAYAGIVIMAGYRARLLQVQTAIIGCGSILNLLFVAEYILLRPFLGARIEAVVATLFIVWSVLVEGHIIARGIQQHWFAGIGIAMIVFMLQIGFQQMLSAEV